MNYPVFYSLVALFVFLFLFAVEPDLTDMTPSNPYERCMILHGDTDREDECNYLK